MTQRGMKSRDSTKNAQHICIISHNYRVGYEWSRGHLGRRATLVSLYLCFLSVGGSLTGDLQVKDFCAQTTLTCTL